MDKKREGEVESVRSVTPPDKFGIVEPQVCATRSPPDGRSDSQALLTQVYRSAFPTPDSFEYLQLLGLRTVMNLSQARCPCRRSVTTTPLPITVEI